MGRKCWEQRAVSGRFPCQGEACGDVYYDLDILPFPLLCARCLLRRVLFPSPFALLIFAKIFKSIFQGIMTFHSQVLQYVCLERENTFLQSSNQNIIWNKVSYNFPILSILNPHSTSPQLPPKRLCYFVQTRI